jgi:HK97 gp10 family phage protein
MSSVRIDISGLQRLSQESGRTFDQILGRAAFDVEAEAKKRAPVETGALRASLMALRVKLNHWIVQDGVEYGVFQELGTSRMAARPFLVPAFEKAMKSLNDRIGAAIERIGQI